MKSFLWSFDPPSADLTLLLLIQEGGCQVYKRKSVHKILVNRLVKLAQEKVWLDELTGLT